MHHLLSSPQGVSEMEVSCMWSDGMQQLLPSRKGTQGADPIYRSNTQRDLQSLFVCASEVTVQEGGPPADRDGMVQHASA